MVTKKKKPSRRPANPTVDNILEQIKPDFLEEGARRITDEDVRRVVEAARELRKEFAEGGSLERFAKDGKRLISIIEAHGNGSFRGTPYWSVALITFTLLYVLKPIDIIPDQLPGIGQLDDALVVSLCLDLVKNDLEHFKKWKLIRDAENA